MDRCAHGYPCAPFRRTRRHDQRSRARGVASRDRSRRHRSAVDRPDHRRDFDPRFRVPEHRVPAAEQARHQERRRGIRRAGRAPASRTRWRRPTASSAAASTARRSSSGAETFSRILDFRTVRPACCSATARGAVILSASEELGSALHADGSYSHILCTPGNVNRGGSIEGSAFLYMDGQAVFSSRSTCSRRSRSRRSRRRISRPSRSTG